MDIRKVIKSHPMPIGPRDISWGADLLSDIMGCPVNRFGKHKSCYGLVKSTPGTRPAYLVEFNRFYISIGEKLMTDDVRNVTHGLIAARKEFNLDGDIDNVYKCKYLLNCMLSLNTFTFDPDYSAKVTQTGRDILTTIIKKLDTVLVDTDRLAIVGATSQEIDFAIKEVSSQYDVDLEYSIDKVTIECSKNPKQYTISKEEQL